MTIIKKISVVLACSDWRLHQDAVHYNKQLAEALEVGGVDIVAFPGPDGLYKKGREDERAVALKHAKVLIEAHHPVSLGIAGHYTCAGNPEDEAAHDAEVALAAERFKAD